ncbi:ZIP family metal transporter [Virgifigura deserti]|uniref:ZIP family metal transporter n=1 Tax=Virgifigura deserti TaxID=2268457 RepID=UPI003CCB84F6
MSDYLTLLAIALLPAGGNFAGGLLAESLRVPPWVIGAALHAAAGVAIAVVSVELMPRVLESLPTWLLVVSFTCGAAFSVLLARGIKWARSGVGVGGAGAWMVYLAVSADLLSDGLMIGAGSAVSSGLGVLLGISQVIANLPGGFATIANFREKQVPRRSRLLTTASFALPAVLGASAGYWLLRGASDRFEHAALAFIVGVLLLATVEDMVPQADEPGAARWISTISFAAGFAFFALFSAYVG